MEEPKITQTGGVFFMTCLTLQAEEARLRDWSGLPYQ
jgi:hypothetical protein